MRTAWVSVWATTTATGTTPGTMSSGPLAQSGAR